MFLIGLKWTMLTAAAICFPVLFLVVRFKLDKNKKEWMYLYMLLSAAFLFLGISEILDSSRSIIYFITSIVISAFFLYRGIKENKKAVKSR